MGFLDPIVANRIERRNVARSNYNPGVTRYDLRREADREGAKVVRDAQRELFLARLEGRTAEQLTGQPGGKGLYLTREQVAELNPSFSGNALVDKYTRSAGSNRLSALALAPGEEPPPEGSIEAAEQGRRGSSAILLAGAALGLYLLVR